MHSSGYQAISLRLTDLTSDERTTDWLAKGQEVYIDCQLAAFGRPSGFLSVFFLVRKLQVLRAPLKSISPHARVGAAQYGFLLLSAVPSTGMPCLGTVDDSTSTSSRLPGCD
jgi:hypothetical protein